MITISLRNNHVAIRTSRMMHRASSISRSTVHRMHILALSSGSRRAERHAKGIVCAPHFSDCGGRLLRVEVWLWGILNGLAVPLQSSEHLSNASSYQYCSMEEGTVLKITSTAQLAHTRPKDIALHRDGQGDIPTSTSTPVARRSRSRSCPRWPHARLGRDQNWLYIICQHMV